MADMCPPKEIGRYFELPTLQVCVVSINLPELDLYDQGYDQTFDTLVEQRTMHRSVSKERQRFE